MLQFLKKTAKSITSNSGFDDKKHKNIELNLFDKFKYLRSEAAATLGS